MACRRNTQVLCWRGSPSSPWVEGSAGLLKAETTDNIVLSLQAIWLLVVQLESPWPWPGCDLTWLCYGDAGSMLHWVTGRDSSRLSQLCPAYGHHGQGWPSVLLPCPIASLPGWNRAVKGLLHSMGEDIFEELVGLWGWGCKTWDWARLLEVLCCNLCSQMFKVIFTGWKSYFILPSRNRDKLMGRWEMPPTPGDVQGC